MKNKIARWSIRIITLSILFISTLILIVFNPNLLYAKKTEVGNFIVFHQSNLDPELPSRLQAVDELIQSSELYDPRFKVKICLNDGSMYPVLFEKLRGPAFGWGFYNIATFRGTFDYSKNKVVLNGYAWNMEQLIAHEVTHCLQANALGMMSANPFGNHAQWKWEGYPEYVARRNAEQTSLMKNIKRIKETREKNPGAWGIFFNDGTVAPGTYYDHWLLVQYCLDIEGMTYSDLLKSDISRGTLEKKMLDWYQNQAENNDARGR
ncbi:MAG: hypothetical protein R3345_01220 [Fulvivirga sp.]|nr:hypothetical protein [Fulvivirga sp.]